MEPMRAVLAAQFWNEEVESTRSLEALVHSVPSEPPALGLLRGSKLSRSQQLLLLQRLFSVPFMPSVEPPNASNKNMGGIVLDRVLASAGGSNWWMTVTGRARAQRFWLLEKQRRLGRSQQRQQPEAASGESGEWWWHRGQRLLDSSLYALSMRTRFHLGSNTFLTASTEVDSLDGLFESPEPRENASPSGVHGLPSPWNARVSLRHKFRGQDLILQSATHAHFVDREARYWDVPQVTSLDLASVRVKGRGLRYRLGVHHSSGDPVECPKEGTAVSAEVPVGAKPGLRAQGAFSFEKEMHLWKKPDTAPTKKTYGLLASHQRVTLSAIAGGLLCAQLGSGRQQPQRESESGQSDVHRTHLSSNVTVGSMSGPVAADVFASMGVTAQFGLFRRLLLDHTKLGVRLDIGAASSLIAATRHPESDARDSSPVPTRADESYPTVALSLQQQVVGPVRVRIDSRFSLDPANLTKGLPNFQDVTYGVDCSLEKLGAAKLLVWYSPDRQEGMAELRLLER